MIPIYIKGERLLYFNELSHEAQIKAKNEILHDEINYIAKLKSQAIKDLHASINNKHVYKNIVRRVEHLKIIKNNDEKLISYIEANLCMFHTDGTYYKFYK